MGAGAALGEDASVARAVVFVPKASLLATAGVGAAAGAGGAAAGDGGAAAAGAAGGGAAFGEGAGAAGGGEAGAGVAGEAAGARAAVSEAFAAGASDPEMLAFVPSTRIAPWHCLHLMETTRPLIFCSKISSEIEKLFPHAGQVTGNGIRGNQAYTLPPRMTQFSVLASAPGPELDGVTGGMLAFLPRRARAEGRRAEGLALPGATRASSLGTSMIRLVSPFGTAFRLASAVSISLPGAA